jgi:hypothetical protein
VGDLGKARAGVVQDGALATGLAQDEVTAWIAGDEGCGEGLTAGDLVQIMV